MNLNIEVPDEIAPLQADGKRGADAKVVSGTFLALPRQEAP